ncbi:inverse autotransporter beta domain-containing protein [Ancylobacter rudongensis]|uniref:Right handed beta helix region n=1 Tax=Ancylobacter rudongensis TaxID=177413 RepID=A0A1G4Q088_9HYPH|nr:inverse autotransporter beta domain-containing protein [Ancylobacter rudongensis]SCW37942.1 Right handed beta helix region [Ancylobacter rudongensis]
MRRAVFPVMLAATVSLPAMADPRGISPASVEATLGSVGDEAFGSFDLFLPMLGDTDRLLFLDARASFGSEQEIEQGSVGLGYRFRHENGWVYGFNGYFDYLNSQYDNGFTQLGVGVEALSQDWELRANGYLPVGDIEAALASANAALIEAGRLVFRAGEETALQGFDGEIGYRLPFLTPDDLTQIKLFAGGYWYTGEGVEDAPGVSARVELSRAGLPAFGNGSRLTLVAGLTYDEQYDTQGIFLARLRVPLGDTSGQAPYDPLYRRVERSDAIRTHVGATGAAEAAVYTETGAVAGRVVAIGAGDDAGTINARLVTAGDGALVLASGTVDVDSTVSLGTDQYLLGGGGALAVRGAVSGGTAVFRNALPAATLNGTDPLDDVLSLDGDRSAVASLALRGGRSGVVAEGVSNIVMRDLDISGTEEHGIALESVSGATIAATRIHNLAFCENNTECEWSIFNPNVVRNAGIAALAVEDLTIRDVTMENVTYGLFVGSQYEEIDWENTITGQSGNLTVENLSIVNSRREGILLVGVDGASLRSVSIDNSAMERSMDLIVLQKTSHATLDDLTLKGGINGLMFASSFNLPGETTDIAVSNAWIEDTYRSGIFLNPSSDIRFTNVTIVNPGSYGVYFYGDAYGFAGGPVTGVSFTDVEVSGSGSSAVYVSGPIQDISGDIATTDVPAPCSADAGQWSGTELIQTGGQVFAIGGATVPAGTLSASCGL